MQPTQELVDAIYREKVLRARQMSGEEKVREGFRLFEDGCQRIGALVRQRMPDASEQLVRDLTLILVERTVRRRQI